MYNFWHIIVYYILKKLALIVVYLNYFRDEISALDLHNIFLISLTKSGWKRKNSKKKYFKKKKQTSKQFPHFIGVFIIAEIESIDSN